MKRKGFTLIEILAVIVILGIIAIIAVPIVSNYITDSRNKTYKAHETTMEEAAKSLTVECIDGKENCSLPSENNSGEIYLSELIDKGFSEKLQNPKGDGYCSETLSYVRITNTGGSDYEYHSCLYCGNYVTEDEGCAEINAVDKGSAPVCGTIEGESSEWTNKPRTITVGCTDPDNDCRFNRFPKTYKNTTSNDHIIISDLKGNTERCSVNVNVDTTPPACEIAKVSGNEENQTNWLSGNVAFAIQNQTDANSGLLTYGIGTSRTPDYNRKSSVNLQDVSGLVTVFGYVKDNAGNEAVCTKTVRIGIERPEFDIYYGYQLLPTKEKYNLTGATISTDETNITLNEANAKLTFSNMNKYDNVKRAVIYLNNYVSNGTTYSLKYDTKSVSGQIYEGTNRIVFEMDKGTYGTYEFTLGNSAGTLNIKRIELEKEKGNTYNTYTNKNITVNLIPSQRTEKVKTEEFSYDDGASYQNVYYKEFSNNSSGNARTKNDIGMISDPKAYVANNFDKTAPTVDDIVPSTTDFTNGKVNLTGKAQDSTSGLVQYAWSTNANLTYSSTEWKDIPGGPKKDKFTDVYEVDSNRTMYFYVKDEAGNIAKKAYTVAVIDLSPPTCTSSSSPAGWTNGSVTVTGKCTDTGVSGCAGNSSVVKSTEYSGAVNPGQVCDKAGNCSPCPNSNVYIDKTAPTCTPTKTVVNSSAGVSVTFSCDNNAGGSTTTCTSAKSGLKASKEYNISDSAGNTGKCKVTVSNKQQKQTTTCNKGKTCSNSAFGTHNGDCNHWRNGSCNSWRNGNCKSWRNGNCKSWSNGSCRSWSNGSCKSYSWSCATGSCGQNANTYSSCYTNSSCSRVCSSYNQVCNSYYQVCNSYEQICTGYEQICNGYQQICDGWVQVNNSKEDIGICGCKTWNSYGGWSDDASCTPNGEHEATNHASKYNCQTVYY